MSAVRRESINLNVNGHYMNGGVAGCSRKKKRNQNTILFSVILAQTICMVIGFILFAYLVDKQLRFEEHSRLQLSDRINALNSELELIKKNMTSKSNRTMPRGPIMPLLHGTAEKMKIVMVERVEEFPEIENLENQKEYDSDEEDDADEETLTSDNAESNVNDDSGQVSTDLNADTFPLGDQVRHRLDLKKDVEQHSSTRNSSGQPALLGNQNTLFDSDDDESDKDEGKQTADDTEIYINPNTGSAPLLSNLSLAQDQETRHRPVPQMNSEKQQQRAANSSARTSNHPRSMKSHPRRRLESSTSDHSELTDDNPEESTNTTPVKEFQMLRRNTNREEDRGYRPRIARAAPEKRHVNPVQDSGQPRLNSFSPTAHSLSMDSEKGTSSAAITEGSWPAAHYNSYDLSSQRPYSADDCPREIQNNQKKWAPSEVPGSEHFDLKNYENITVRKEGLYFVYSQIYFYKDRSIFGYLIKRENQAVLQCSIHTPTNRTSNGSGTTCFTAGLVYLKANDVLRLEIFSESGKCVRWGPGKSFIGMYRLPQDLSTFV